MQGILYLLLFGCGFGYCGYRVYSSLTQREGTVIRVRSINPGKYIGKEIETSSVTPAVADKETATIRYIRHNIDSLQYTPGLQKKYDSLIEGRPGLLDSLRLLEKLIKP